MSKIRVLIVDDSITMQKLLVSMLASDSEIEVVGVAINPYGARELIKKFNPDVLLLDVEMPHMDGITFLKNIMRLRPMPVIMVSSYTLPGKILTLDALAIGAIDCIPKPTARDLANNFSYIQHLVQIVKVAAKVKNARVCFI